GVLDLRGVVPALAVVGRARQLGAPVTVAERGPQRAAVGLARDEVDTLPAMAGQPRSPATACLVDDERALACTHQDRTGHVLLHPPLSACMIITCELGSTRSLSRPRSAIICASTNTLTWRRNRPRSSHM